jgi:glycosyltransferase involved in cell wall biosynthesis
MKNATAVVYPSRYEGFGIPTIEAMALDVPIIASNATSVPEVVGDGGILVHPDDDKAMSQAMVSVLRDSDLRNHLILKGRARLHHFHRERLGNEMISLFETNGEK